MTFIKNQARLTFALLVSVLFMLAIAACEDPNGAPGGEPGFDAPGDPAPNGGF